ADVSVSLDELVLGLKQIGAEIGMEVTVRLHGERAPKRVALLGSKRPHCLQQTLAERQAGLLNGELVVVISNHEDLRSIAETAGLPYYALPSADKAAHFGFGGG